MVETTKQRIVIVEDEGLIAADLQGRLEAAGYSVSPIASSGVEALQIIRETPPDLVLMDIRLRGDLDGIQVADQVRKEFDVPVVYLTAYEDRGTLERASQTQAFGYIKKPIASASLQGSIEMAISKHRHERYLREQRDWFSANFAALPDAVMVTDGFGTICYLNRVGEELTGWKAEKALGHRYAELLRLYYRQSGRSAEDLVPAVMLQGETIALPANVCLRRENGSSYAIEGSVAPKWSNGRVEGTVIVFKDVTAGRFEEDQSRLDCKQEALARMADGIARHLDLDLSMVAEESSRLLEALPPESALRQGAKTIERAATDAFAATCRLQAFAEPPEIRTEPVSPNEILTRLEAAWKRVVPGLTLRLDPNPSLVRADAWQLTRTLVTILLHARNWMDAEAKLVVEVSRAEHQPMRQWVRIRISYPSALEDAESLERSFEPSWSSEPEELPVAYALVKKMNGLMTAQLDSGASVNFEIYLPQAEDAAATASPNWSGQPAILLVEPNSEVRRVICAHLERNGYNVLEAATCGEAVLLAELYDGPIPLAIANPAKGNANRQELPSALQAIKPMMSVKMLDGYWEERQPAGPPGAQPALHFMTKWDLLEWAKGAIGKGELVPAADCVSAGT